jgi:hypothetical protein
VFNTGDSLLLSFVGQHGASNDISDGENIWNVSLEMRVDDDSKFRALIKYLLLSSYLIPSSLAPKPSLKGLLPTETKMLSAVKV